MGEANVSEEDIVIDETQSNYIHRVELIRYLKALGYQVNGVYLKTDVEECIKRRSIDSKGISDCNWAQIIYAMNSSYVEPSMKDGFNDLLIHGGDML
jgi:predicted kinase